MRAKGTIIGLLGVWLIVAAIWRFFQIGEIWSDLLIGIVTAILGFSMVGSRPLNAWVAGIAGLWMIASAFIPGLHAGGGILVNNVITGLVLVVTGFTIRDVPRPGSTTSRAA